MCMYHVCLLYASMEVYTNFHITVYPEEGMRVVKHDTVIQEINAVFY